MNGKTRQSEAVDLYRPDDLQPSFWAVCFTISLFIHMAALGVLFFSPAGASKTDSLNTSKAIKVDLVSFNPEVPASPEKDGTGTEPESEPDSGAVALKKEKSGEKTQDKKSDKKPEKEAVSVKKGIRKNISKDYELKTPDPPEPDVKTSLKKKTFDSEKVIEDAVNRIAKDSENRRPKSIEERIASLESQVGDKTYKGRLSSEAADQTGTAADPGDFAPIEIYQAEVAVAMKQNWAFSREVAGQTEGLETRLVIKIMPEGKIADVWFEKRSGNSYLDESAYKTVMKADPLPPLPEGYPHYHLVLGFTPGGLKR